MSRSQVQGDWRWEGTAGKKPYIMQPRCILVQSSQHSTVRDKQNPLLELQRRTTYQPEEFGLWRKLKKCLRFLFTHPLSPELKIGEQEQDSFREVGWSILHT